MRKSILRILKAAVAASVISAAAFAVAVAADAQPFWPKEAKLYFISPQDGAVVSSPVTVQFGLSGLGVAPAGVDKAKTGHHHLLIDADLPANLNEAIPGDEHHVHFGGGQTETQVKLAPGMHTLQLLMGDMNHIPHDKPLASQKITITVK